MYKSKNPPPGKVKYNLKEGVAEAMPEAVDRFYRLHNGQWIRARAKRNKQIWKKSLAKRAYLAEHVMVTPSQAKLLDRMVSADYKEVRHYPEDPYEHYHKWSALPMLRDWKFKKFYP